MADNSLIVTSELARALAQEEGLSVDRANQLVGLTMEQATAKVVEWLGEVGKL